MIGSELSSAGKRIREISKTDQIVRVVARVISTRPFVVDDGTGRALVNGSCSYREGEVVRILGRVSPTEKEVLPVLTPIIVQEMNGLDLELYGELYRIKSMIGIVKTNGK